MKRTHVIAVLALLAAAASGCERGAPGRPGPGGGFGMRNPLRFQVVATATETLLVDAATGDLWILEEEPGAQPGKWVPYAKGPKNVRPLGPPPQAKPSPAP